MEKLEAVLQAERSARQTVARAHESAQETLVAARVRSAEISAVARETADRELTQQRSVVLGSADAQVAAMTDEAHTALDRTLADARERMPAAVAAVSKTLEG